jgi:hypothetical protein
VTGRAGAPSAARQVLARQLAGALVVYLVLAYALTINAWRDPGNHWIGNCCDQEQSTWFLAWLPTALQSGQDPLLTDRLNAPNGANLMWNSSSPLVAFLAAPITRAGGPVLAYNVALVAAIVVSGLACFVALRRLTARPLGPLIGGGLYAISPYMASQAVLHLNLVLAWAPPVILILLDDLLVRRNRPPWLVGIALGVVAAIQLLTFEEVLATTAVAAGVLILVMTFLAGDTRRVLESARGAVGALPTAAASFLLIGGLPLAVQFLGPQQLHGQVQQASTFSTDLLNVVVPTSYQLLAPAAATAVASGFSGLFHEATAYVGVPLLAVLAWIVIGRRRDPRVRVAAWMAVAMFVLSLGPELHVGGTSLGVPMPWLPIGSLPLLEHALPGRLTLYMWLAIAGLVALGIDHAVALPGPQAIARLALVGGALVFVLPVPLNASTAEVPQFFRTWSEQGIRRDDIVLVAPWFTDGAGADPMLWAAVAEAQPRMYEGYVYVPDGQGRPRYGPPEGALSQLMTAIQDQGNPLLARGSARENALRELADRHIAAVIVGPMRYRELMVAMFTDLLGVPPVETGGVELWRNVPDRLTGLGAGTG